MDPLSATASIAGLVAPLVQLIWKLSKTAIEIDEAPETSKVFVRILEQIGRDVQHSIACYDQIAPHLGGSCPQVDWAVQAIEAAILELSQFRNFMDNVDKITFKDKAAFVLKDYKQLIDKERAIRFAHSRLLTAIGTMHAMTLQLGLHVSPARAKQSQRRLPPAPQRVTIENPQNAIHAVLHSSRVALRYD